MISNGLQDLTSRQQSGRSLTSLFSQHPHPPVMRQASDTACRPGRIEASMLWLRGLVAATKEHTGTRLWSSPAHKPSV